MSRNRSMDDDAGAGYARQMAQHIGARILYYRKRRGLTQKQVAELSGLTQSALSLAERGLIAISRKSTQVALASALQISEAQLLGQPMRISDASRDRTLRHVPSIRSTLVELSAGESSTPQRDADQLRRDVAELTELRNAADYARLAPLLPALLRDLAAHGPALGALMVEALFATRYALRSIGHQDLAMQAAELGLRAAREHGAPTWIAQATYSLVQAYPADNAALGARILARTADELQGNPDRQAQEMYGCLRLLIAHTEAVAGRAAAARENLAEAADVARALGEPPRYGQLSAGLNGNWFGPTQVQIWEIAVAAELEDTGAALAVFGRVDPALLPLPNRMVYLHTDMARGLVAGGDDAAAIAHLSRAEASAPQHFRFNTAAQDLLLAIIQRAKVGAVTSRMADLARKLHLDVV